MAQRISVLAIVASLISITGQPSQAEPDLGEVVGTIARTILEQQQGAHERALWDGVVANGSAAAYRQYLDTYPEGPNAQAARDQLARLEAATAAETRAAQSELRLGLAREDRVAVQRRLAAGGYYTAGIDGAFGAGTRRAITAWQRANGFGPTGYLDQRQLPLLLDRADARPAAPAPAADVAATSAAQAELNLGLTRAQRVQIQHDLIDLGYDPKGADGLFGTGTREAIRAWQRNTGQGATGYMTAAMISALRADAEARGSEASVDRAAAVDEDLLGLTRAERTRVQQRLISLGYLRGQADGVFGSTTRSAIGRWQGDNGLAETGYLTAEQVRTLQEQARI
ncbi:peptidoglycan-binding domain-containing protein [Paracoccus tibetensis]|uniref:Peptidoglycan-binding (PGRP) domain of peptidoglycan hydrolases-containing protein n=1 Tax=Paracoccus tibetensis TaxID=336292 RepID=A0A1G5FU79_9RHOB|nr:peptidoglycan-binding protein [Paracoccus tibetensis]SCY42704.1 Peptidoglycan-binding (PGRP) domain of peptidoglycan hydrolases-containing protein [Paracoccus tibetensis]